MQPLVLKIRQSTFGNPQLDSKHPLCLDCRSQGRRFHQVADSQNFSRYIPALDQQPEFEWRQHFMRIKLIYMSWCSAQTSSFPFLGSLLVQKKKKGAFSDLTGESRVMVP